MAIPFTLAACLTGLVTAMGASCLPNLISDIQKLALAWNKVLLSGLDGDDNNDVDEEPGDDVDDKSSPLEKPKEKDHKYFKSPLFKKKTYRRKSTRLSLLSMLSLC